jgi:catechol 2,3-dioxygenase-like lactoylglutathione lyase family enzyme
MARAARRYFALRGPNFEQVGTQMTTGSDAPPKTGWAKLVPELLVSDIAASLEFWCNRLGFAIAYQRPEEAFAYLERPEGAQIMLSQRSGKWETAPLVRPYGRGAMFQLYVASIAPVARSLESAGWPLYAGPREVWREVGDRQAGQREIFVLDPDGYLVMVANDLGERPLSEARP